MRNSILLFVILTAFCLKAENLLRNTEFEHNDSGEYYEWSDISKDVTFLPGQGPEGRNALKVDLSKIVVMKQTEIKLIEGEMYRVGGYIKTRNFKANRGRICIYDTPGWNRDNGTGGIPENCPEWTWLEAIVPAPPSKDSGMYSFGIFAVDASGELWVSGFVLEPVSPKAIAESKPAPIYKSNRIVPTSHILHQLPCGDIDLVFYHQPSSVAKKQFTSSWEIRVDGDNDFGKPYTGKCVDGNISVKLKGLKPGKGTIRIQIFEEGKTEAVASNEYPLTVLSEPQKKSKGASEPRKLNNVVSELYSGKLDNGKVEFFNPREGWVFIGFDKPYRETIALLDEEKTPVVLYRENEPSETMRYLSQGNHVIEITGATGGSLVVRAVPDLFMYPLFMVNKTELDIFRYDLDFYKKHLFHNANFFVAEGNYSREAVGFLKERGIRFVGSGGFSQTVWRDGEKMEKNIREGWQVKSTDGRTLDELAANATGAIRYAYCDATWNLMDLDKIIYTWVCGGRLWSPSTHKEIFAAASNVSKGRGKVLYETYIVTQPTEDAMEQYLQDYREFALDGEKLVNNANQRMLMIMTGLISHGRYNVYVHPYVDIKYFFDRFFQILAKDKAFDGLQGFGCYNNAHTDEETTRWIAAIMRHYGIEGRTDLLSDKYGFKYIPGHLQNGDFEDGLANWQAVPAEQDSLKPHTIKNFGRQVQLRRPGAGERINGNFMALFKRSSKAPNLLSQRAVNLVPWKLYTLNYTVSDLEDATKKLSERPSLEINAILENADIVPELTFTHKWPTQGKKKSEFVALDTHRILFRAKASSVKITFSDWKNDKIPGGPIGQSLVMNFVNVKPYFSEE